MFFYVKTPLFCPVCVSRWGVLSIHVPIGEIARSVNSRWNKISSPTTIIVEGDRSGSLVVLGKETCGGSSPGHLPRVGSRSLWKPIGICEIPVFVSLSPSPFLISFPGTGLWSCVIWSPVWETPLIHVRACWGVRRWVIIVSEIRCDTSVSHFETRCIPLSRTAPKNIHDNTMLNFFLFLVFLLWGFFCIFLYFF